MWWRYLQVVTCRNIYLVSFSLSCKLYNCDVVWISNHLSPNANKLHRYNVLCNKHVVSWDSWRTFRLLLVVWLSGEFLQKFTQHCMVSDSTTPDNKTHQSKLVMFRGIHPEPPRQFVACCIIMLITPNYMIWFILPVYWYKKERDTLLHKVRFISTK